MDFNRENGGLVFQPFLDFRVEIFTEDGHFLAISVFIIVTGLKPQNKKQFGVRLYRQFWEKFIDMSQKFVDEYRECQYTLPHKINAASTKMTATSAAIQTQFFE